VHPTMGQWRIEDQEIATEHAKRAHTRMVGDVALVEGTDCDTCRIITMRAELRKMPPV
jgi:hypothetical protein